MSTSTSTPGAAALLPGKAGAGDRDAVVSVLTDAFFADPVIGWLLPDPARRKVLLPRVWDVAVELNEPGDEIWLTRPEAAAAAVWTPPGPPPSAEEGEAEVTRYLAVAEEHVERFQTCFDLMGEQHPEEPHAYLFLLGARPDWQGKGLGSVLLRAVLDRCDADGTPAYLEATCEDNQRLYRRHGFVNTGEIRLPDGPSLWPMWRDPSPV